MDVNHDAYGHCNMDIFTEWHNAYYLFAGHNCGIYDLNLKLFISRNDWENNVVMTSEDANLLGCADVDNETVACKYFLTPANSKLGIAFKNGSDADWTYDTEWSDCVDNK